MGQPADDIETMAEQDQPSKITDEVTAPDAEVVADEAVAEEKTEETIEVNVPAEPEAKEE